jgi:hypothetical protein
MTREGFVLATDGESLHRVRWSDVEEVFAFKLDLLTTDCICLGFRISDNKSGQTPGTIVCVNEEMVGWDELSQAIAHAYPEYKEGWWSEVAFPAFATNYTTVWRQRRS